MPSRLRTASPPSLPISPAVSGETTPSSAAASSGRLEPVGTERPGDVDVVGVARAAGGDDRDVVEAVGPAGLLAASDLYFHCGIVERAADDSGEAIRARIDGGNHRAFDASSGIEDLRALAAPAAVGAPAQPISAPISSRSASTSSSSSLDPRPGSMMPAPKCCVDSAPQATPKRRHSTGERPA